MGFDSQVHTAPIPGYAVSIAPRSSSKVFLVTPPLLVLAIALISVGHRNTMQRPAQEQTI